MLILSGIDIVNIKRIEKVATQKGKIFLERVFSKDEIIYCEARVNKFQHYAARFAAKEAFIKAYPNGTSLFALNQIEVKKSNNVPYICLNSEKEYVLPESTSLSISHEKEYAVAVVVLQIKT